MAVAYAGALWATRRWYRDNPAIKAKVSKVLTDLYRACGLKSRLAAPMVGRYLRHKMQSESRRLETGWTYEPPTFCETKQTVAAGAG